MDRKEILEVIQRFKERRDKTKNLVKEFCQDKSIPLEERWEVFITSGLGDHDSWYHDADGIDWDRYTLHDNFYCDRHEVMKVDRMLTLAKQGNMFEENGEEAFKEYFLDKFVYSFENDW
jgi:hypothetical protein